MLSNFIVKGDSGDHSRHAVELENFYLLMFRYSKQCYHVTLVFIGTSISLYLCRKTRPKFSNSSKFWENNREAAKLRRGGAAPRFSESLLKKKNGSAQRTGAHLCQNPLVIKSRLEEEDG